MEVGALERDKKFLGKSVEATKARCDMLESQVGQNVTLHTALNLC